ncbi:Transcription factor [Arachis hypogaea]|nr:Transcription factor [Arachis hypogaea]
MSGRRQRSSGRSEFTENEINDLASRLQALLPQPNQQTRNSRQVSVLEILKETCSHIKRLQKDVEDLSETLTGLNSEQATVREEELYVGQDRTPRREYLEKILRRSSLLSTFLIFQMGEAELICSRAELFGWPRIRVTYHSPQACLGLDRTKASFRTRNAPILGR